MTALEHARTVVAEWTRRGGGNSASPHWVRVLRALVEYTEQVEADALAGQAEHARWQERAETAEAKLAENGSCWDLAPMPPVPPGECGPTPPHCILRAGHKGAHRGEVEIGIGFPPEWITRDAHNTLLERAAAAEARLTEVLALHAPVTEEMYPADCANGECEHDMGDECPLEPVEVCRHCFDTALASEAARSEDIVSIWTWPCPTARAAGCEEA